ncbi:hypothetical protein DE146DRAFT_427653 [Phaeosphaeria sp. MPI-PUGE-AT-0046c]|nr:hypothetical protein DE146DRAFT_427653 [Phaeosphaeria sp. MPI-PUGE-AT-0046c]
MASLLTYQPLCFLCRLSFAFALLASLIGQVAGPWGVSVAICTDEDDDLHSNSYHCRLRLQFGCMCVGCMCVGCMCVACSCGCGVVIGEDLIEIAVGVPMC